MTGKEMIVIISLIIFCNIFSVFMMAYTIESNCDKYNAAYINGNKYYCMSEKALEELKGDVE